MATLAQALQLIGSWIAPLIIFLVKRQSRFVSFHALQALLFQSGGRVVCPHVLYAGPAFWGQERPSDRFPCFLPVNLAVFCGCGIVNLVVAIVYAIKAGQGEWAEYPLLGRLARKMLKIGPGGAPLSAQA